MPFSDNQFDQELLAFLKYSFADGNIFCAPPPFPVYVFICPS